jgi:hypothetical protein
MILTMRLRHRRRSLLAAAPLLLSLLLAGSAPAADSFFTVGGGYSPVSNQVSLEKNVLYFQRVLKDLKLDGRPHYILFADGNDPARDLVTLDISHPPPPIFPLLARILAKPDGTWEEYRDHAIPHVADRANIDTIEAHLADVGPKLTDADRLVVYFTGHGGRAPDAKHPQNTRMHLWNGQDILMSDFAKQLDKVPVNTPVVLVMVQCFSGGFADVIFKDGDPAHGLDDHRRCGFFATVQDRTAAGCTSDINEANYQEYSTQFWAALCGKDRLGRAVAQPDFDNDGQVSLSEAHAYVIIHSTTIDIPVKTSDAFLRHVSADKSPAGKKIDDLFTRKTSFSRLVAVAGPTDRAVLEALGVELKLGGEDRASECEKRAGDIEAERKTLEQKKTTLQNESNAIRNELAALLKTRWPEFNNFFHPRVTQVLQNQPKDVMKLLTGHPRFQRFELIDEEIDKIEKQLLDLEKSWAKHQRYLRVSESVALEFNLPKIAEPPVLERYKALLKLENAPLAAP